MPVTEVVKDWSALTLTVRCEFPVSVERVWQLLADPRQLERWWGPPMYPATVVEHDLTPGGRVIYYMTTPEGDRPHGWWRVRSVDAPWSLEVEDGFGDADGKPDPDMPTGLMRVVIEAVEGGARMSTISTFPSLEAMEQLLAMGQEEGMRQAAGQIDGILAESA